MTELEQLRKEVNELRERLAKLEARPHSPPLIDWAKHAGAVPQPSCRPMGLWLDPVLFPPGTVLC